MTPQQFELTLLVLNTAPIKTVQEARNKASCMLWLADELDPPKDEKPADPDKPAD